MSFGWTRPSSQWWLACVLMTVSLVALPARPAFAADIVLYASDVTFMTGGASRVSSTTGAGGQLITTPDNGFATLNAPLASPSQYLEASFQADAAQTYHVWLRLRATANSKWNESVWVQFTNALTVVGAVQWRIGSTSGLLVNLERCSGCGVSGWGWQDRAWWTGQSPLVRFSSSGTQTIRIQTREDGVQVDQIVLATASSPYYNAAPGSAVNDSTILPKPTGGTTTAAPTSRVIALPGTLQVEDFMEGGQSVAYYDASLGNNGGQYRQTDVDIESTYGGGYNVGWVSAGEWLKYSVNVSAAGTYSAQARVACSGAGGTFHIEVDGSNVSGTMRIPDTGGWQQWRTVSANISLPAGSHVLKLSFDSWGTYAVGNFDSLAVTAGTTTTTTTTTTGNLRLMTWNVQSGRGMNGVYDPAAQVRIMADHAADVIVLQEVETWIENQPALFRNLLQQVTGRTWYSVYAPNTPYAGTIGDLILSRIPIAASSVTIMQANPGNPADYLGNRGAARARIGVNGVGVEILNTHLDYQNTSYRTTQLLMFMDWARQFPGPRLVGGDFNSWWGEYWISQMQTEYSDTWRDVTGSVEGGYTRDQVRFDYIFRSYDQATRARPTRIYVVQTDKSDHRPVVADFTIQ